MDLLHYNVMSNQLTIRLRLLVVVEYIITQKMIVSHVYGRGGSLNRDVTFIRHVQILRHQVIDMFILRPAFGGNYNV